MIVISQAVVAVALLLPTQASPPAGPWDPVVTIRRTGGFAGIDERVSLFSDGKALDEMGRVRHIPPADIVRFTQSVEKAGTPTADEVTFPSQPCTDCHLYVVSIRKGESIRRFVLEEPIQHSSAQESEPAKIIRGLLSQIFGEHQRK